MLIDVSELGQDLSRKLGKQQDRIPVPNGVFPGRKAGDPRRGNLGWRLFAKWSVIRIEMLVWSTSDSSVRLLMPTQVYVQCSSDTQLIVRFLSRAQAMGPCREQLGYFPGMRGKPPRPRLTAGGKDGDGVCVHVYV